MLQLMNTRPDFYYKNLNLYELLENVKHKSAKIDNKIYFSTTKDKERESHSSLYDIV